MKRLFILLSILYSVSSRKVEVDVQRIATSGETNPGSLISITDKYCSVSGVSSPANAGSATYSSKCSLIIDEDNQKSTDYDYTTPTYFSQPTQIKTDDDNKEGKEKCSGVVNSNGDITFDKCIVYSVKVDNEEPAGTADENKVKYSGCNVELRGIGSSATGTAPNIVHTGSKIHLQEIDKILGLETDNHDVSKLSNDNAVYVASTRTCYFMPVNHKFLGKVEAIVKFKLTDPQQDEVDDLYVRIPINFVPHLASRFGATGADVFMDQHDAFVLLGESNVNNKLNDKCKAVDGIDFIGMKRSDNADLTGASCQNAGMTNGLSACSSKTNLVKGSSQVLNTRSTGSGCKTTGTKAHLYTESESAGEKSASLSNSLNPSYKQIQVSDGTAVKFRLMGHFIDRRYKIADQTGVEALEDSIGNFKITTQSLNIKADYIKIGHTRQDHETTGLNLAKLNLDDYGSVCKKQILKSNFDETKQLPSPGIETNDKHLLNTGCVAEDSDSWSSASSSSTVSANIDGHQYAQYYFDHDHHVAYEHIKHVQDSYINDNPSCGTTGYGQNGVACSNAFIIAGFSNDVIVKLPVDIEANIPKAPWNVYIPKLDIQSYGDAKIMKVSSDARLPTYGLPVLDTSLEPQYIDGYPLSHFFKINGVLDCEASIANCDEVDSYDDKYEVFARLTKVESNSNAAEYYDDISGTSILCSSNRASSSDGAYGQGRVRDAGVVYVTDQGVPVGTYIIQSQLYFDKCRIKITENTYLDQVIFSWKNALDAAMCQEDEDTVLDLSKVCTGYTPPARSTATNFANGICTECAKLTVIDRRKVLIGSTELSLLRRQEVFAGQGVEVSGSSIGFLLGKQNGIDEKIGSTGTTAGQAYGEGVLEFDIWGTDSMQGYKNDATQCLPADTQESGGSGPYCQEAHGCNIADGLFGAAVDGDSADQCAEKKVKTPRNDGEFTFHTIRSNSNCNGKLDIQLRLRQSGDADCDTNEDCTIRLWNAQNLLNEAGSPVGFLRPVYDVRFPCSRVSRKTSDSIKLKYVFDLAYNLQSDQFTIGAQGVDTLNGVALTFADNKFSSQTNTGLSGFTKKIEYKPFIGACPNSVTQFQAGVCSPSFAKDDNKAGRAEAAVAGSCDDLVFSNTPSTGTVVSLDQDITLGLVYKRIYSYKVDRDHLLDGQVADTEIAEDTQWFCEDQKFSISLNPTKTASVSVITPIQLVIERQAQIVGITWHGDNEANVAPYTDAQFSKCGAQQYQLRVLVKLREQGTHTSNSAPADWSNLLETFTSSISSGTDGLTATNIVDDSGATYVALTSPCILVTADDCTGLLDSQWKDLTETSTTLLVSSLDTVLGAGSATGTTVTSEVSINTDYSSCPIDIEDVEESGEFAAAVSFDAGNCLANGGQTALDNTGTAITNCASALVTDSGTASIHAYSIASGTSLLDAGANAQYIQGSKLASAGGSMSIDTGSVVLKRYEKAFGGDEKGQQLGDDILLCSKATGADLAPNTGVQLEGFNLSPAVGTNKFDCGFSFLAFGQADLLNDIWEIEIEIVMKNTARRLRASKELKLKSSDPLSGSVGFSILSDTTTVTEDTQASALVEPQTSEPVHHKEGEVDAGMIALIAIGVVLVVAVGWYLMKGRKRQAYAAVPNPAAGGGGSGGGVQPRFSKLRY